MGIELMIGVTGGSSGSASAPPPPPHLNVGEMWAQQRSGDARKQCVSCLLNIEMGGEGGGEVGGEGGGQIARGAPPRRGICSGTGIDVVSRLLFLSMVESQI